TGDTTGDTTGNDTTGNDTTGNDTTGNDTTSTGGDGGPGFGFPLGDKTTSPAGGAPWAYWRGLGVRIDDQGGAHLASDIGWSDGAYQDFYAVADGEVLVQSENASLYKHIILIKHDMGDGTYVCSFYGHIDAPLVDPGDPITRGQAIGTVMQWPDPYPDNNHLHYAIVPQETCDYMVSNMGGSKCGYDVAADSAPGVVDGDPSTEPWLYYPVDPAEDWKCKMQGHPIHSATQFINMHHY
ncbi:MAG: M23 family metallopeptidase, partial [Myxococcales bacterium]|nr:M23 family metallopeptidase [Myxococcales bacterium]